MKDAQRRAKWRRHGSGRWSCKWDVKCRLHLHANEISFSQEVELHTPVRGCQIVQPLFARRAPCSRIRLRNHSQLKSQRWHYEIFDIQLRVVVFFWVFMSFRGLHFWCVRFDFWFPTCSLCGGFQDSSFDDAVWESCFFSEVIAKYEFRRSTETHFAIMCSPPVAS